MTAKTLEDFNLKLIYKPLKELLGYFDEKTNEIIINNKKNYDF